MPNSLEFWVIFHLLILGLVYVDLKVLHRNVSKITLRSIIGCCLFWLGLAVAFNVWVAVAFDAHAAVAFSTAYLLESSLSVDNLFLFLVVFSFCRIQPVHQHRVLYFGILGALVFRLLFIVLGIELLHRFEWMYFVFGGFLCFSAICFFKKEEGSEDLSKSFLVKMAKKLFRLDHGEHHGKFFVKKQGKMHVTMLFLALFLIECSDIVFAIDSVPAVLAVTSDFFIAYTSNIFAVLGLRSLYFLLAHLKDRFVHLKTGVAIILFFIGLKMLLLSVWKVPVAVTLGFIAATLAISIAASFRIPSKKK